MNTLNDERLKKKDVIKMYQIDRSTLESWISERGLPVIEVSSHSKYIRMKDLIEWENNLIKNKIELK